MERAALGAQQTLGQRLPSSDRVRRSGGWDELVWGGGEVVGGSCRGSRRDLKALVARIHLRLGPADVRSSPPPAEPTASAHDLSGDSFFEAGGGLRIERKGDGL